MKVYNYNDNKVFIGEEDAAIDPLETKIQQKEVYIMPANSTIVKPTKCKENELNVWNGEKWEVRENNEGKITINPQTKEIIKLGVLDNISDGFFEINQEELEKLYSSQYMELEINDDKINVVEREKTYVENRLESYPSISDQLDMLYWDKVNGTNNWEQSITEIKEKYPKD